MQALYFYVISSHVIVIIKTLHFDTTFLIQYTNTKLHLQQPFFISSRVCLLFEVCYFAYDCASVCRNS